MRYLLLALLFTSGCATKMNYPCTFKPTITVDYMLPVDAECHKRAWLNDRGDMVDSALDGHGNRVYAKQYITGCAFAAENRIVTTRESAGHEVNHLIDAYCK